MGSQRTYSNGLNTRNVEHPVCLSVRCIRELVSLIQLSLWIVWIALLFICDATLPIYYSLHTSAQIVTGSIKPKAESLRSA
ncbi:Uncharacterized protein HZ326_28874 [Fusarium oxysporum f. sp. albedinis]|nr:Uncharacterized protein HZ326_28874 [Fusarium oxysporum f. sp. albedinis]